MHQSKPEPITLLYVEDDAATRKMITRPLGKSALIASPQKTGRKV
jgi:hypothetical protein